MNSEKKDLFLPVLLKVTDKKILMIGAGLACREKLRSLGQLGIEITVIAPEIHEEFLGKSWIQIIQREYQKEDFSGYDIVYVGVNNPVLEGQILRDAREFDVLINFVDKRDFSDFISPSVLQKENFSIFISTFGKGPGAAKIIRQEIEEKINLDDLDTMTGEYIKKRKTTK